MVAFGQSSLQYLKYSGFYVKGSFWIRSTRKGGKILWVALIPNEGKYLTIIEPVADSHKRIYVP